jgi:CelD/BcsL family acetyltransferase involved in cellulose biosynthesis
MVETRRAMPDLIFQVTRPGALGPDDIARWRSFLQATPALAAPFLSHAYAAAAERCFADVRVLKCVEDGETVAFFPFQFRSALHRMAGIGQVISDDLADYFGLVARSGFALRSDDLLRGAGLSAMYFTHLEEGQTSFGLSGEQPEPGLRIEFPQGGAAFWSELEKRDKKFLADTQRRARKLKDAHGPLRFVFRREDNGEELQRLIAAKRSQYGRTGVADPLDSPVKRKFLAEIATLRDSDCRATLSTLHAGDRWVGSHFGLMCGSTLHYWFPVYNPDMRAFSPGRLLIKAIIDAAEENGVTRIDRGAGTSAAKLDFATSQHRFFRGLWARRSPTSLAYRVALSAQWRLHAIWNRQSAGAAT